MAKITIEASIYQSTEETLKEFSSHLFSCFSREISEPENMIYKKYHHVTNQMCVILKSYIKQVILKTITYYFK